MSKYDFITAMDEINKYQYDSTEMILNWQLLIVQEPKDVTFNFFDSTSYTIPNIAKVMERYAGFADRLLNLEVLFNNHESRILALENEVKSSTDSFTGFFIYIDNSEIDNPQPQSVLISPGKCKIYQNKDIYKEVNVIQLTTLTLIENSTSWISYSPGNNGCVTSMSDFDSIGLKYIYIFICIDSNRGTKFIADYSSVGKNIPFDYKRRIGIIAIENIGSTKYLKPYSYGTIIYDNNIANYYGNREFKNIPVKQSLSNSKELSFTKNNISIDSCEFIGTEVFPTSDTIESISCNITIVCETSLIPTDLIVSNAHGYFTKLFIGNNTIFQQNFTVSGYPDKITMSTNYPSDSVVQSISLTILSWKEDRRITNPLPYLV